MNILALSFFVTAFFYSMAGFGGGSSYIALLAIFAISHKVAPSLALFCNLIVVTGSTIHFYRKGLLNKKLLASFALTSVPAAYFGGRLHLGADTYQAILATALLVAALNMLFFKKRRGQAVIYPSLFKSSLTGTLLGLLSGMVGIGGGIFLSPLMHTLRWGKAHEISALSAGFILVNSLSGLIGQLHKGISFSPYEYAPLFLAVFVGGQAGALLSIFKIHTRKIEVVTAVLIIVASARLYSSL